MTLLGKLEIDDYSDKILLDLMEFII